MFSENKTSDKADFLYKKKQSKFSYAETGQIAIGGAELQTICITFSKAQRLSQK